jgi:hypothetical protein
LLLKKIHGTSLVCKFGDPAANINYGRPEMFDGFITGVKEVADWFTAGVKSLVRN